MIHQHPDKVMRYFKWGVARLILEAEPCPDLLPIWIDGPQEVMSNERTFPRFIPRAGKDVVVSFGELVDREEVLEPLRARWRELKEKARRKRLTSSSTKSGASSLASGDDVDEVEVLGELHSDILKYSPEAEQLRIDVTLAVRNEVLKVRRAYGLPDEDPKRGLAETFRVEGGEKTAGGDGVKRDGSSVRGG